MYVAACILHTHMLENLFWCPYIVFYVGVSKRQSVATLFSIQYQGRCIFVIARCEIPNYHNKMLFCICNNVLVGEKH